jgi:hypothetical protein
MWDFEIIAVEKTRPPMPAQQGNWYHYTIANRITEISGMRRGSRCEVMHFVQSSVERLNNRHRGPAFSSS